MSEFITITSVLLVCGVIAILNLEQTDYQRRARKRRINRKRGN